MSSPRLVLAVILACSALFAGCNSVDRAENYCSFLATGNEPGDENNFNPANCIYGVRVLQRHAASMGNNQAAVDASLEYCDRHISDSQSRAECRLGVITLRDSVIESAAHRASRRERLADPAPRPGQRI